MINTAACFTLPLNIQFTFGHLLTATITGVSLLPPFLPHCPVVVHLPNLAISVWILGGGGGGWVICVWEMLESINFLESRLDLFLLLHACLLPNWAPHHVTPFFCLTRIMKKAICKWISTWILILHFDDTIMVKISQSWGNGVWYEIEQAHLNTNLLGFVKWTRVKDAWIRCSFGHTSYL